MVDYVNVKYGTSWLFDNEVSDEILDDILKRVYENQQRQKDDKATGTEIINDVDKENVNVEVVLKKPKNDKLKGKEFIILDSDTCNSDDSWEPTNSVNKITSKSVLKGKHDLSSISFKGRKGSPSKKGKDNRVNILKSIDEGPFRMGILRETLTEGTEGALHLGPERPRVYSDLTSEEKDSGMRNIKMTMSMMQLNLKFVNNMLPEWGRFITAVKLNRGLRDSIYDQLCFYLKQHEAHVNENKMMSDQFTQHTVDPLALMSNVLNQQHYPRSFTTPPSTYVQPQSGDTTQLDSGISPIKNLIENLTNTLSLLTQSCKTYLPQTNNQLRTSLNPRNQAIIQDGRVVIQNVQGRQNRGQGNNARGVGAGAASYGGAQNRVGYANPGQARKIKYYNCNGIGHLARNYTQLRRSQNSEYFKDKMLLMQAQENGVALDEEQLLFIIGGQDNVVDEDVDEKPIQDLALNVDNMFQADDCDVFDFDVDEALTAQTMFMADLSSAYPVFYEADPFYDSDILSEVHDHDHYHDVVCEHHEVHEMHEDVQPNYVVDSHADYMSDSNMIPYDQYVKDNLVPTIQINVSSVPNDAYMMILNDMHEQPAQHVSVTTHNNVVDKSLTVELATYKEQVKLYKRQARFELTEREQKIDEQLRIVITDRNIKEEKLKKELHSIKMQLASTINHNNSMIKVAIGYKTPLHLTRAKQVQPALYNFHEIIKIDHVPVIVHNSEDTLEIAEITRKKMNEKMKKPLWTHNKINIRPPDYSNENFLATFTPQTQLTPKQIFWSKYVLKMKIEALKEQAKAAKSVKALTVYPHNTPVKLVPRTCKKRITPMVLTEEERGFEQTKECYLTEVIPFFKMLKEHFKGIQKALTTKIKEMKAIFDELEAKVDQNAVNRKCDEIERKNFLEGIVISQPHKRRNGSIDADNC
uniref:Integrase, catalytic region, zinc finger, CCHC-type, peptidase aspartic, catalytic n=1 Tax=Tanacetum cinerariifolium TaxID=118510 RepID=A0A6L2KP17_TANCI|nr:hypothetical protein [Tanacetum cinerariifolium]